MEKNMKSHFPSFHGNASRMVVVVLAASGAE